MPAQRFGVAALLLALILARQLLGEAVRDKEIHASEHQREPKRIVLGGIEVKRRYVVSGAANVVEILYCWRVQVPVRGRAGKGSEPFELLYVTAEGEARVAGFKTAEVAADLA